MWKVQFIYRQEGKAGSYGYYCQSTLFSNGGQKCLTCETKTDKNLKKHHQQQQNPNT